MTYPDDRRPADLEWAVVVPAGGATAPPAPAGAVEAPRRRVVLALSLLALVVTATACVVAVRSVQERARTEAAAGISRGNAMGSYGASYAFTWLNPDGSPVRWNPCQPIDWVASASLAPRGALDDFQAALDRVTALTGLRFRFLGEVDERPASERAASQPRYGSGWAPMLVSWAPLAGTPLGQGLGTGADTVGVATPIAISRPGSPGVIVTAQIVFESGRSLPPGFATSGARGAVMLHEIAHALGLAHVDDPSQLMFDGDHAGVGAGELGFGDSIGLEQVGAGGGCLPEPTPDDVE